MKLTFVRHGESQANLLHEISNRGWKHPLSAAGRSQARQLAHSLKRGSVQRIFTSPVQRAVESALFLSRHLKAPLEIATPLAEFDCGALEGRSDEEAWELHSALRRDWALHHFWDRSLPGGESFNDIRRRFLPFVEELLRRYAGEDDHLLLVGHGGTYHAMLPLILANIDAEFAAQHPLEHTHQVQAELQDGRLVCRRWGEALFPAQPLPPLEHETIYHITFPAQWLAGCEAGKYTAASLETQGFIHLSTRAQAAGSANKHFTGKRGLLLLHVDARKLRAPVRYENLEGGDNLFPHLYGALNLDAVLDCTPWEPDRHGVFTLPEGV